MHVSGFSSVYSINDMASVTSVAYFIAVVNNFSVSGVATFYAVSSVVYFLYVTVAFC